MWRSYVSRLVTNELNLSSEHLGPSRPALPSLRDQVQALAGRLDQLATDVASFRPQEPDEDESVIVCEEGHDTISSPVALVEISAKHPEREKVVGRVCYCWRCEVSFLFVHGQRLSAKSSTPPSEDQARSDVGRPGRPAPSGPQVRFSRGKR